MIHSELVLAFKINKQHPDLSASRFRFIHDKVQHNSAVFAGAE
jgi:hypothetical protein